MPELPEVEAFKAYIESHCLHKKITAVSVVIPKVLQQVSAAHLQKKLIGHQFVAITRSGKYLVLALNKSSESIVLHFGMTGSLEYTPASQQVRFSAVNFIFDNQTSLHFKSVRTFEKLWLIDGKMSIKSINELGPDALKLSYPAFKKIISTYKKRNIKALLMDQKVMAGIGNEYSDEILFQAGIDPHHTVSDLSETTMKILYKKMHQVLTYFIKVCSKAIEYNAHDFPSRANRLTFQSTYLQAHRHIDMICPKHKKHRLKKATIAGRTSYYCPIDQV